MSGDPQSVRGHEILQKVAGQALDDDVFRQRLIEDPKSVLREAGLEVGDDIELVVHENTSDRVHLVLPAHPQDAQKLNIDEIDLALLINTVGF